ncbi:MAG: YIP1 family protein [Anaerolineae bacterium]|nr:YIP1 family protein [Anaerolineae bacterium]
MDFNRILNGMIRAARLDKEFYEEVERDTSYGQDALAVVILAALAAGIGSFIGSLFTGSNILVAIGSLIFGVIVAVLAYFVWVFVAQYVGTRFFKGQGDFGEVQRAFGFAYAPQVLNVLSFIPCVGWVLPLVTWLWSLATGFVAIRQSLDQDDTNAALTMVVSFLVVLVISVILGLIGGALGLAGAAITGALTR